MTEESGLPTPKLNQICLTEHLETNPCDKIVRQLRTDSLHYICLPLSVRHEKTWKCTLLCLFLTSILKTRIQLPSWNLNTTEMSQTCALEYSSYKHIKKKPHWTKGFGFVSQWSQSNVSDVRCVALLKLLQKRGKGYIPGQFSSAQNHDIFHPGWC